MFEERVRMGCILFPVIQLLLWSQKPLLEESLLIFGTSVSATHHLKFFNASLLPFKSFFLGRVILFLFVNSVAVVKVVNIHFILLTVSTQPLELVHSDAWGKAPTPSTTSFKYYVLFIDGFSKYAWLYPLINKSDICTVFRQIQVIC